MRRLRSKVLTSALALLASTVGTAVTCAQGAAPPPAQAEGRAWDRGSGQPVSVKPSPPPMVQQIGAAALAMQLRRREIRTALFDVREEREYAVSHLAGAIRIDPAMPATDFLTRYGARLAGASAVFYCTIGGRSGTFLETVEDGAKQVGARSTLTLQGGIIAWANAGLPLTNDKSCTRKVHPFSRELASRLNNPAKVRY
jgi:rhodanese-related sulfurtransferase